MLLLFGFSVAISDVVNWKTEKANRMATGWCQSIDFDRMVQVLGRKKENEEKFRQKQKSTAGNAAAHVGAVASHAFR